MDVEGCVKTVLDSRVWQLMTVFHATDTRVKGLDAKAKNWVHGGYELCGGSHCCRMAGYVQLEAFFSFYGE